MDSILQCIIFLASVVLFQTVCAGSNSIDVKSILQRLGHLEEKVRDQELMYEKRISDLEKENKVHQGTIEKLLDVMMKNNHSGSGSFDNVANRLERALLRPITAPERRVAFHARLAKDITQLNVGQDIVFDHEVLDTGNDYNSLNGQFTAPLTGIYVFYWNLLTNELAQMDTTLVSTDGPLGYGYVDKGNQGYANGGNMVIALLNEGTRVFLKKADKYGNFLHERFSTFSGFLLYDLS